MRLCIVTIVAGLLALSLADCSAKAAGAVEHYDNGVGLTPAMGWSSWSFLRRDPTAAKIEAQARALKSSGLAGVGYDYVNLDDFWYECPGSQGPNVDAYGRWLVDWTKFPPRGDVNGIRVVADYVHSLGLKFGLYVTPGISLQAVANNTPILGPNDRPTGYTASEIAVLTKSENNYNCGGMVAIDYRKPGAQDFIDSWAREFASWGVDYLKLDGVGSFDLPDVEAWSKALKATGRPIHLELSNRLDRRFARKWERYSNGWRTGDDIECYRCEKNGSSYPLTDWANVALRFDQVARWQPYGGPGGFNDYDSIEVGNGSDDGLTLDERMTQLSLWALAASPLILGTDLTRLDSVDLALLMNRAVIAVDQDGLDASRIAMGRGYQVFAKREKSGDAVVGLFNTAERRESIRTTSAALGLGAVGSFTVTNLWTGQVSGTTGRIEADVSPHGVALLRIAPTKKN